MLDGRQQCLSVLDVLRLPDLLGKIEVIPANDGVFDEPPASFGHFLFDLFPRQKVMVVPERDGLRELIGIFALVQLLFNRLPKFHVINETQNKVRFRDFAEFFERLIQGMLFRVGVESSEELRGGGFFQLDGGNEAQDLVPLGFDERRFDIGSLAPRVRNFTLRRWCPVPEAWWGVSASPVGPFFPILCIQFLCPIPLGRYNRGLLTRFDALCRQ
jgi:hypothetical protein